MVRDLEAVADALLPRPFADGNRGEREMKRVGEAVRVYAAPGQA